MDVIRDDGTSIHLLLAGDGDPTTVFVHGLVQSATDVRIFGSGVAGTRAFMDLRGHGASATAPERGQAQWTYRTLADDVAAAVEMLGATRALGVSAGASTLLTLLVQPDVHLEKVVLMLPNSLRRRNEPQLAMVDQMADAIGANNQVELSRLLLRLQPESVRGRVDVGLWARRQATRLGGTSAAAATRALPRDIPLDDVAALQKVQAQVLVLSQRDDEAHPVAAGEELVGLIPGAQLVVSDKPWIWTARQELRETLVAFLNS